ncbi:hypothetical protein ESCO_002910 [Escovopsis weberi]|uniref:DUF7704 domain-containing protein n=1 Tax=Escovopsis weberi TaxID=150374 RepID=A0A0M8N131_ESCWE|nr:hypothetical protein ESCO_002910 [Escovopsis weberi]
MAASLPSIPRLVFTVLEPLSLVAGFIGAVHDPSWFVQQQVPLEAPAPVTKESVVLALQLGNMYLLTFLVGVAVLFTTSEIRVVRNYLVALWLADIGHIAFSCYGLGREKLLDPAGWNATTWGNIGATSLLCLVRSAYLAGLFGPDRPVAKAPGKKAN